ncbi:MAG: carboxy terminal-processing peptidase [Rariglobus sp.]|nr:carboxy terminal-processing peptidase [Rariglobus sp.]
MHLTTRAARRFLVVFSLALAVCVSHAQQQPTETFTPDQTNIEASALVQLLEQYHYNRDSVSSAAYAEVIPDFMGSLDGSRLFFLESDKTEFTTRYKPDSIYWTVTSRGRIEPAYVVFDVYKKRVTERAAWIQEALKKTFDLSGKDSYLLDRSKAPWPATSAEADTLWDQRLRYELIKEVLNKKTVEEAKTTIAKRYERRLKNIADIEPSDVAELFLSSIARLYDPHSTYFSADTYEDFGIQMRLQLVGIGALLSLEDDYCVIKDIIPGGPADLDKQLKPNDKIISVAQDDAEPIEVIGMKLRKIVDMIRGTKGTRVHLLIESSASGSATRKEVVLTRNVVNLDSSRAHGAIFEVPDASGKIAPIGVITLPTFYGPDYSKDGKAQNSATKDIEELITRMKASKIEGLVLDLRRNGGGLLNEAISLTGLFIPQGPVVQVRAYSGEIKVDDDEDSSVAYDGPLTVLVSRYSASASEIVAGALQNYGRAVIVGDSSTHGKGTVQTVLELRNLVPQLAKSGVKSGATKLTIQKFYLPNGSSTQLKGIVPDVILPSANDYLPIGESDLPHALVWDSIKTSTFDGHPLAPSVLTPLIAASTQRQQKLPEFSFLRRAIDRFKTRQEEKSVSLNLDTRKQQKESDKAFQKTMKTERKELAASDFTFTEVMLAPPPAPRPKPAKSPDDEPEEEDDLDEDENIRYPSVDIHLREALRIIQDMIHSPDVLKASKAVAVMPPVASAP